MIIFLRKNKYLILLVVISLISHSQWLNPFSILNSSDWNYWPNEAVQQLAISWGSWMSMFNFGSGNIQIPFLFFMSIWAFITKLGLSYDVATKLTFLIPIAVFGFITPYVLFKKLTKTESVSFVVALFYGTTTYFLVRQTAHIPVAFVYALAPLIFYLFIRALEINKMVNWLVFIIVYWISVCYEIRITYILTYLFLFYFILLYTLDIKKYLKNILVSILLLIGLNIFWLLPTVLGGLSVDITAVANRGLFGSSLFDIGHSFTLFNDPWTGGLPSSQFVKQPIFWYFWFIPIIIFSSFLLERNNKYKKVVIYYGTISLIGVFLTKQAAEPFVGVYLWLYNHFPGFNLFREASKFYLLTAIGYAGLVGYGLLSLKGNRNVILRKYVFSIFSIILVVTSLWNLKPLITGEIKTMFVSKDIPSDYVILKDFILKQPGYFRTFWTPKYSRWGIFVNQKPKISNVGVIGSEWKGLFEVYNKNEKLTQDKIINVFRFSFSDKLINASSIKYVIVPIQDIENNDDFFQFYGEKENPDVRQWYIDQLDKISWLKRKDVGAKELVVYENEHYLPYFRSLDSLVSFDFFQNLDQKSAFISSEFDKGLEFIASSEEDDLNFPTLHTHLLFDKVSLSNIQKSILKTSFDGIGKSLRIFMNVGNKSVFLADDGENMNLFSEAEDHLSISGNQLGISSDLKKLNSIPKNPNNTYFAQIGSRLFPINGESRQNFGIIRKKFDILATSTQDNLIPNGSFQEGLWSNKVGDCNNYDDDGELGITISDNASDESKSVELQATRHIACTGPDPIRIKEGKKYLFSFDYQSPNARQAGYYIEFNDSSDTVIREKLPVSGEDWRSFSRGIDVPTGATFAKLFIYSYSVDNKTEIVTRYDNFYLSPLEHVATIDPQYQENFQRIDLPKQDEYGFTYHDPEYDFSNLIRKPSFEEGLWSNTVGDCNNSDANGKIGIVQSNIASDGESSLELQATRHIACTGPGVLPATEDKTYFLSFDYQSPNGNQAGYYLGFNDPNKTAISERLPISDKEWHAFSKQVKVPEGASSVSLVVYGYSQDEKTNIITRYDNFKFIELPDLENRYYVVSDPQTNFVDPREITFDLVNPTKKLVHIKGATTPFYLAMSESYHPQWQAQLSNAKIGVADSGTSNFGLSTLYSRFIASWIPWVKPDRVSDDKHFELDGFLNGWFVDTAKLCQVESDESQVKSGCTKNSDGSYDIEMTVEFFPQRWFYLGLLISGTTLVGCLGYLGYDFMKRRRESRKVKILSSPNLYRS